MDKILFVGLNMADAWLTKSALNLGAIELNPVTVGWGSNVIAKGIVAIIVILALYLFYKEKLLLPLNFVLFGVVLWNLATNMILRVI